MSTCGITHGTPSRYHLRDDCRFAPRNSSVAIDAPGNMEAISPVPAAPHPSKLSSRELLPQTTVRSLGSCKMYWTLEQFVILDASHISRPF